MAPHSPFNTDYWHFLMSPIKEYYHHLGRKEVWQFYWHIFVYDAIEFCLRCYGRNGRVRGSWQLWAVVSIGMWVFAAKHAVAPIPAEETPEDTSLQELIPSA